MPYTQGTRVEITPGKHGGGGMSEFHGKRGTVIGYERDGQMTLHRVKLDEPVFVKGVGKVTDDLWSAEYLKEIDDEFEEGGEDDPNWDTNTKSARRRGKI